MLFGACFLKNALKAISVELQNGCISQQYGLHHQLSPHFLLPVIDTECLEEVEPMGYSVIG